MRTTSRNILLASSLVYMSAAAAHAFTVPWHCLHNGTQSGSATWSATSTIGQPATGPASGGTFLMDSGYEGGARPLPAPSICLGDTNNDNIINTTDLVFFLGKFGQTVPPGSPADLNNDGVVNTADLVAFLGRFGQSCP